MAPAESNDLIEKQPSKQEIKIYKRRWLILLIYVLYSTGNSFQWMEYSIITNIVMKFYNVDALDVDLTSIIYVAIYPIIVIPVSYIIEKKGLRVAALIGGLGTALAAAVKLFSVGKDLFYVVLIGQAIGSTAQVFVLCLPPKIAAVWFKPSEASTASALGVFGVQLGLALGFLIPPTLVKNHDDMELLASNFRTLCWGLVIFMIPVCAAIVFYFPNHPPLPPSVAQERERKSPPPTFREFITSFRILMKHKGFVFHTIAYGINVAVFAAIGTFLNQFLLQYFPNSGEDAGRMAFFAVICGMIGSMIFGIFLDKTKKYKETTLFVYIMTALSCVSVVLTLILRNKSLVYLTYIIFGIFSNSYLSVGFEFAVEITFPSNESTTTGILNAATQASGVVSMVGLGKFNEHYGALWSLVSQVILLVFGIYLTLRVSNEKKRQEAFLRYSKSEAEENL